MRAPQIIIRRPLLTEKSTQLRERGGRDPGDQLGVEEGEETNLAQKIVFEVAKDANKIEIRKAVESLFSVNVTDVHTMVVRGKKKRVGRFIGRTSTIKKAIVTLKAGDNIEFFEGV